MKVVFFKNKETNEFHMHQVLPKDWCKNECEKKIRDYNKQNSVNEAVLFVIEEGSIEEYLIQKADQKLTFNKEVLQDAINAVENARNLLECLC